MGRDKALVEVDGVPMVARAIEALRGSGASPVVLVGGDAAALARFGVEVVADRWPGQGPLAGLATALTAAAVAHADVVLVVATDQPWLEAADLGLLVAAVAADDAVVGAVADRGRGRFDGLPGAWRPSFGPAVVGAVEAGHRRLDHLPDLGSVVVVPAPRPDALADVDEPADLDQPGR
jgi:molybdopterin-guanine dinucleotide biosynthesis protein A